MILRLDSVTNFAAAVWRFGRRLVRRAARRTEPPAFLTNAQIDARLRTCGGCDWFAHGSRQCRACTCFVDVKAILSTEDCPLGRWKRL